MALAPVQSLRIWRQKKIPMFLNRVLGRETAVGPLTLTIDP